MNRMVGVWPVVFLVITGLVFFYKTITLGLLPVPSDALVGLYHPWRDYFATEYPRGVPFKNFLISDPVRQQIPWRKIAIDQWRDGKIPWWNPFSFSGTPLIGNIQAAVFYPLNIIFFIFNFPTAWTILIVLQPLLASIFFYLFVRSKNISVPGAILGSLAWSFSGFMIAWMTWGTIGHVALWLPLLLFAIEKNRFWLFMFAMVMQLLAGHAQISLYITVLVLLYAWWEQKFSKTVVFGLVGAGIITIGQWWPFIQTLLLATRATEAGITKPGWLMPWYHLVQFLVPDFYGNPATLNYWGEWNYGEFIGYIGVIPLLFAFRSIFGHVKDAVFWKFTLIGSIFLMVSEPVTTFFYGLGLPIISTLQPTRLMVVGVFSLAMLAVYGFEEWNRVKKIEVKPVILLMLVMGGLWAGAIFGSDANLSISRNNLILPTTMLIVGILLYARKGRRVVIFLIIVFTIFDLFRFGWKFTPFTKSEYFFPETKIISFLKSQLQPFRVMVVDDRLLPPNTTAYYGIETINGYDPVIYEPYELMLAASERGEPSYAGPSGFNRIIVAKNINSPLISNLNVLYVLSLDEIVNLNLEKILEEGQTKVYKYIPGRPRVFWENYDYTELQPRISNYQIGNIILEYEISEERDLIISEIYRPGWRVLIDGKPATVREGDYHLMQLTVPEGKHKVEVKYM